MKPVTRLADVWSLAEAVRRFFTQPPRSLKMLGKLLYYTLAGKFYRDGGCGPDCPSYAVMLRWWHPFSWVFWLACLIVLFPLCAVYGAKITEEMPSFRLKPYWRKPENRARLEWFNHW